MLVLDGERSLVANLAAANKFTPDHLVTTSWRVLLVLCLLAEAANGGIACIEGGQGLGRPYDSALSAKEGAATRPYQVN